MVFTQIVAMVRKDLQQFFSDRRAVIMSFAVPIAIASFFGSIFSGPSRNSEPARIPIIVVDQDESVISKAIVSGYGPSLSMTASRRSPPDGEHSQGPRPDNPALAAGSGG